MDDVGTQRPHPVAHGPDLGQPAFWKPEQPQRQALQLIPGLCRRAAIGQNRVVMVRCAPDVILEGRRDAGPERLDNMEDLRKLQGQDWVSADDEENEDLDEAESPSASASRSG